MGRPGARGAATLPTSASPGVGAAEGEQCRRALSSLISCPSPPFHALQGVSATTTRRQLAALDQLSEYDPNCQGEMAVRALLLGARQAKLLAEQRTAWAKEEAWIADAGAALCRLEGINDSQRKAVATALTRTLTLWQVGRGRGVSRCTECLLERLLVGACCQNACWPR